jgi:UPF0716 family protein affecting phage T7 exclusion
VREQLESPVVRWVVPAGVLVVAIVLLVIGGSVGTYAGVVVLCVAIGLCAAANLGRRAVASQEDRAAEERAREFFERHGRWPDEPVT